MTENTIKMQQKHAELLREERERVRMTWQVFDKKYRFDDTISRCYDRYRNYKFQGLHWLAEQYKIKVGIK